MLTATLGGLIKDHRLRKRLSQLEVSLKIGWSDATRLSKIEQGRVRKPTRKTLDKIMEALDLDDHERGQMLLVGTGIPTYQEGIEVINSLKDAIDFFKFPVLLIDIYWNTYLVNNQFIKIWQIPPEGVKFIKDKFPNWTELLFLTDYLKNEEVFGGYKESKLVPFNEYQVSHFKYELNESFSEVWLQKLLSKLGSNNEFKRLWQETKPLPIDDHLLYDYEFNRFIVEESNSKKVLNFHVFSVRPTFDARFYFMVHVPADKETEKFFKNN